MLGHQSSSEKSRVVGLILFCCSLLIVVLTYKLVSFWMTTPGGSFHTVYYEVKPNSSPQTVARELEKLGVVSSARMFYWYARSTGKTRKFKAGDYRFTTRMRPDEVLTIVMSGISFGLPFTIPEGYNMYQVADLVESMRSGSKTRFLKLCSDKNFITKLGFFPPPPSLEGYLFPDTYVMQRKTSEEELISQMLRRFREVYTPELASRARDLKLTERQVVTLASIIEKETGAEHERAMISSVVHNRLKKRMRLAMDTTVIYGMWQRYTGNIRKRDLEEVTPYNTYRIKGLPPGPIANPGKEALQAALFPAEGEYLFFVSRNDGTHEFTSTYEDHNRAVVKYQRDRKAREGKSWRDLKRSSQQTVVD